MEVSNKNICFISAYAAIYGGNFIKMLQALSAQLILHYQCNIFFIFPKQDNKDWLDELAKCYTIGYISSTNTTNEISSYLNKWDIDLVHSNFERYDVPIAKAINRLKKEIKQVWHIHDYMTLDKTGLSLPHIRKFITNRKFWIHYGKWGKNAFFIPVSDEMAHFVNHYRTHQFTYPKAFSHDSFEQETIIRSETVINGIDLSRISDIESYNRPHEPFTFVTFGGYAQLKGIPTILDACEILSQKKVHFKLLITESDSTKQLIEDRYNDNNPDWLTTKDQTDNISDIFSAADCYISASRKETMSMAIAEASLFGLPIIQSDIPGTEWNASSPSTFLFPVDNATVLSQMMGKVMNLTENGSIKAMTEESKILNQNRLKMDLWVNRIISIYKTI
jgi:glycosyltransferase involved in cell wall biosynthesis